MASDFSTGKVLDLVFRDPVVKHGLEEFRDLDKTPEQILSIYAKPVASGPAKGEIRYYLTCFKRAQPIQVYSEQKSNPEEIV